MLLAVVLLAPVLTRGPMLVGVTSESAYVVWQTSEKQTNGTVRIGSAPGNYPGSAQDASYTETHHVQLTGLLPATTYHYAIDSDPQAQDSTFTTAPAGPALTPIRFIVYGDSRTNTSDHQSVVNAIRQEPNISFLLHTGDMAQNYPFSQEWDTFFQVEHDLLRSTPLFPTIGNHETLDSLYTWGLYFSPPRFNPDPGGSVRYYSADWGAVHLVSLDTFDQTGPAIDPKLDTISDAQLEWMKADLDAARARRQTIFISLHHGAVSHAVGPDAHGGSQLILNEVIPELAARHVTAAFAGHDHIYERGCTFGVDYFVAGGGGAPLYPVADGGLPPSVLSLHSTLAYSVITVQGASVSGLTKNEHGIQIDSFVLPSAGCQSDAGIDDPLPDAGQPDAGGTGTTTTTARACGSAGAATLLCLLPLAFLRRRRRA